jgi:AcrR family transcriptional regulator
MDSMSRKEKEKLLREEDIVNAAEKVFTIMGYNKASMEDIAKEAQLTRKTVYQYFADKDDLFFTVIIRGFKRLLSYCKEDIGTGITGYENLRKLASAYDRFYHDYPGTLQLMNYVGYVKPCKNNLKLEEFNHVSELLVQEISKVINDGKADGSIRSDLDTTKLTLSVEFIVSGFFHMLTISGKTFTNHFSLNEENFIDFSINLLCDALTKK